MARLYDLAKVIRSKNSGPFEITLDVLFDNVERYQKVKNSNIITKKLISQLYKVDEDKVTVLVFYDQAYGIKVTFARSKSSGSCHDRDVYGAQQHVLLSEVEVPI